MSDPKALVVMRLAPGGVERLRTGCDLIDAAGKSRDEVRGMLADCEGILVPAPWIIDNAILDAAPRLRVVSNFGVGYNNVDFEELAKRGIVVCNTPGVLSAAVAELTFGIMLMGSRRLMENDDYVRSGKWGQVAPPAAGFDLKGKTLGIIGLGRIGREVARRARVFGMRVIFYDLFDEAPDGSEAEYYPLDELLAEADIVTLHTNLTAESTHMIAMPQLRRMKQSAWLINTSRGPVVKEDDLAAALGEGVIAGAALDVMEVEPLPANAPIRNAPNTILVPHIGTATTETRLLMQELCISNLLNVLNGEIPEACVNPEILPRALQRRG